MKAIYVAPAIIVSGDAVRQTKGSVNPPGDGPGFIEPTGSVGFYL
jgi:hypothetical protein